MFEDKLIRCDSLENTRENGLRTGFRFAVRLASDHGTWVSLIGGFLVRVDGGNAYPPEALSLEIPGLPRLPVTGLKDHPWDRWPSDAEAWLYVDQPGGLEPGDHSIEFQELILSGYFKAREEWVEHPPVPGTTGKTHTFFCRVKEDDR